MKISMKVKDFPMSAESFAAITGNLPQHDDLERVNCTQVGEPGHRQCGVCKHGMPAFLHCPTCHGAELEYERAKVFCASPPPNMAVARFFYINLQWGSHQANLSFKQLFEVMQADRADTDEIAQAIAMALLIHVGESVLWARGHIIRLKDTK